MKFKIDVFICFEWNWFAVSCVSTCELNFNFKAEQLVPTERASSPNLFLCRFKVVTAAMLMPWAAFCYMYVCVSVGNGPESPEFIY